MTRVDESRRAEVVIEHMESENDQDWARTMATFSHPRYELPDGSVHDGEHDVKAYWVDGRSLVPDQRNELIELTHLNGHRSMIEFWLRGTPVKSGRAFERRLWAIFDFDDEGLMVNERVFLEPPTADQVVGKVTPDGRPA